jgi:hypothetical protein
VTDALAENDLAAEFIERACATNRAARRPSEFWITTATHARRRQRPRQPTGRNPTRRPRINDEPRCWALM